MTDPMELIVARADIDGGTVKIETDHPKGLEVDRDVTLVLKFPYKLREDSREREEYRFVLRSRLDGEDAAPAALARWGDRWGLPDEIWGTVQQVIPAAAEGEHVLEFDVEAEYVVAPWGSAVADVYDRARASGRIVVTVR